jgi:hypothetical protein
MRLLPLLKLVGVCRQQNLSSKTPIFLSVGKKRRRIPNRSDVFMELALVRVFARFQLFGEGMPLAWQDTRRRPRAFRQQAFALGGGHFLVQALVGEIPVHGAAFILS